jgi:type I restriction enzyme S subunit
MIKGWEYIRFGDLFDYENKSKIKAGEGVKLGRYPFYTSSADLTKFINDFQFDKTSLIFGTGGNASIHYSETPFSVSTDCLVAFPKDKKIVEIKYVYYYILGNINLLKEGFKGAGLKHISKGYINEIIIPLPSITIQKSIVKILDTSSALNRKNNEILKKYDELLLAVFTDIFGDPVKNNKSWALKPLSAFGKIKTGNTPKRSENKFYNSKCIEWIKTDNILENNLNISIAKEYLSNDGAKVGRTTFAGSLLVTCIAGSIESIGRAALTNREVAFNQQINCIEPNEKVNSIFLYFLFKCSMKYIQSNSSNGMKRMISKGVFEKINMILPDIETQKKFEINALQILLQLNNIKKVVELGNDLHDSLTKKAFKGELLA